MNSSSTGLKFPLPTILFLIFFLLKLSHAAQPIPNLNLATALVPDKTGFTMLGNAAGDRLGWVVSKAGDVNGDGFDDIIIGAYYKASQQGEVYVVYGRPGSSLADFTVSSSTLNPATTGFTIKGSAPGDYFGYSVGTAGDVDKDGYADIIVGAYRKDTYKGIVYVIYGKPMASMTNIDLSITTLNPKFTGFTITGNAINDYFAWSVNTAGDVNKDTYADIIIGAYQKDNLKGAAYVIFGGPKDSMQNLDLQTTPLNPSSTGFLITGSAINDNFGYAVGPAGDVNGDGRDDIIIGASGKDSARGAVYIIYGSETFSQAQIDLSTITLDPTTTGFVITGQTTGDQFGAAISPVAGDINKDGFADIIVGAYARDSYKGAAYVIYGKTSSTMTNLALSSIALTPILTGFSIAGITIDDYLGFALSFAGDINGDGYGDILIGAFRVSSWKGATYVIYGAEKSSMPTITLSTLNPATTGLTITGNANNDRLGYSVSAAGDFNKDGYADIVVGAWGKTSSQGATYLIHATCVTSTAAPCTTRDFCQSCDSTYSASNPNCLNCPSNCLQYSGPTSCQTCGSGYFVSNSQCSLCISNCQQCTDSTSCGTCAATYIYYQSQCIQNCPLTTYPSAGTCANCITNCATCTSNSDCQTCAQGYWKSGPSQCSPCISNCQQCSDSTSCDTCDSTYLYYQSQCIQNCPSAKYPSGGTCQDCSSNCALCSSNTVCQTCDQGYYKTGSSQCSLCISNCQQCSDSSSCTTCDATYYYYQSQCIQNCPPTTYPSAGTCANCIANCVSCSSNTVCQTCDQGYYKTGSSQCSSCISNCQQCSDTTSCNTCDATYLYYQSQCIQNCPAGKYSSTGTCQDCLSNCASCTSNSDCQTCAQGYWKSGSSQCSACSQNCQQCSDSSSCTTCDATYHYYQSQCLPNCPLGKYPSGGTCNDCSTHCSSCLSSSSCQICESGYTLSDSQCILPETKNKTTTTSAPQKIAATFTALGSAVCVGSSTFLSTRLISETVQNMRYVDLVVPKDLIEMYQSWQTDLISWEFPNAMSNVDQFKPPPRLFSQYDIESPFLDNFWSNLMTISIGLGIFLTSIVLIKISKQAKVHKFLSSLLQGLKAGALNFTIAQTYESLHDTLFYFVLDVKTNPRNSFFAWACLLSGIIFVGIGTFLVFSNLYLVCKYQRLKKEGQAKNDMSDFNAFQEKNKTFELFYSDFDDSNILSHSFLAILTMRSGISAIIITSLYQNTVSQMILLILIDIVMIFFLIIKKPLLTLRATLVQYFCEIIAFFVHACVFMLAMQNNREEAPDKFKDTLSTTLRYLNIALIAGTTGFMIFEIFKTIQESVKAWRSKKKIKLPAQPLASENSVIHQDSLSLSVMQPINQTINIQQHFNISMNQSPGRLNNQYNISPEFLRDQNNISFTGLNFQAPQNFDSTMEITMDNSAVHEAETSNWSSPQRDQTRVTNISRRRVRIKMDNRLAHQPRFN